MPNPRRPAKVLKQRGFPIPGIAAQNDESDFSPQNVAIQRIFERGFNVGLLSEVRVEAARFSVSPARAGVGLQQGLQPIHLVLPANERFRWRLYGITTVLVNRFISVCMTRWTQSGLCFNRRRKSLRLGRDVVAWSRNAVTVG